METIIGKDINIAASLLSDGKVVGIPTETVYGLAANALNPKAVADIFSIKNRPNFDPLIVHLENFKEVAKYASEIPEAFFEIAKKFSPGPLTYVLKKKPNIPDIVTSGNDTIALRIPSHPMTNQLLHKLDFPLAAPSANPFGYISPTSAYHVYEQLQGKIPYILDGGHCNVGLESTIIGLENQKIVVYRLGGTSIEDLQTTGLEIELRLSQSSNPKAPGQLKSHYAPRIPLKILKANENIPSALANERTGFLGFSKFHPKLPLQNQRILSEKGDLQEAAINVFKMMRELDSMNLKIIYCQLTPDHGLGRAINDRLKRAAA